MKADLDHLPATKQRELERVVQIIFEEFEDALVLATQDWKKKGRIQKIVSPTTASSTSLHQRRQIKRPTWRRNIVTNGCRAPQSF